MKYYIFDKTSHSYVAAGPLGKWPGFTWARQREDAVSFTSVSAVLKWMWECGARTTLANARRPVIAPTDEYVIVQDAS